MIVADYSRQDDIDFTHMPSLKFGGGNIGRAALAVAIEELNLGAREIGGKNSGPWVIKYLNGLAPEGSPWCAAFVSFCFAKSGLTMPFEYSVSARQLFNQFKLKKWTQAKSEIFTAEPGDIVVWWRGSPENWQGHIGLVHHCEHKWLHTIEGNRTARVAGFSYRITGLRRLLGFGRVPDIINSKS
ncbi:MAG: CHAP domain-containing protein [Candidatus Zixiibacteriota bacterium]